MARQFVLEGQDERPDMLSGRFLAAAAVAAGPRPASGRRAATLTSAGCRQAGSRPVTVPFSARRAITRSLAGCPWRGTIATGLGRRATARARAAESALRPNLPGPCAAAHAS